MTRPVDKKLLISPFFDQSVYTAFEKLEVFQSGADDSYCRFMGFVESRSRFDGVDGGQLRCQDNIVKRFLRSAEVAVDRESARDIGAVAIQLGSRIDQQEVPFAQSVSVIDVMQHAGIGTPSHDRRVGRILRAALAKYVFQLGFDLVLTHARCAASHGPPVSVNRNSCRFFHDTKLRRAFDQAQFMQNAAQINQFSWRGDAATPAGFDITQPAQQLLVKARVAAQVAIDPGTVLQQARKNVLDILKGEGIIGAKRVDGALESDSSSIPHFLYRIALTTENQKFAVSPSRSQYCHCLGFGKACEVEKITVGSITVLDVTIATGPGGARNHGNAIAQMTHQALAPLRVVSGSCHSTRLNPWVGPPLGAGVWLRKSAEQRPAGIPRSRQGLFRRQVQPRWCRPVQYLRYRL